MSELAGPEATIRVGQLERPQEVASLLEVGSNRVDLVDQVLHTDNAVLAQVVLDDLVVRQGEALLVDLAITTLVDQFTHGFEARVAVGNVGVDDREHLRGRLGKTDENAVVGLEQTKELQDLARLRSNLVHTGRVPCKHGALHTTLQKKEMYTYPLRRMTNTSLGSSGT